MDQNQQQNLPTRFAGASGIATRVFAIFGFIALLGIGMWGSVSLASGVPGAFSSLAAAFVSLTSVFVPANEAVILSVPSLTVPSGTAFTLSWTHAHQSIQGSYTFRYDCADGVSFTSPTSSGTDATVYCNVPFNFLNANDAISLTPISTKNRFVDVAVYVDFTPNGASKATVTGKTTLTIENDSIAGSPTATVQPATPNTQQTYVAPSAGPATTQTYRLGSNGTQVSNPNGSVDLVARIVEVGIVSSSGVFTASSTPSLSSLTGGNRIAVHFSIENDGTKISPQFNFNAVLPTLPIDIFSSPMQQSLAPGDRIEFTMGFDSFDNSSARVFTVNADPSGSINEANKANNIATVTINTTP